MRLTLDPPADPGAYPYVHRVRVRFAETDAMGIVHHAAYLPYLESARVEYLRALGHPYTELREAGLNFPVIEVALRYLRPTSFDELVDVHLLATSATGATFQLAYLLAVDGEARVLAATAHAVVGDDGRPVRTPPWLRDLVSGG